MTQMVMISKYLKLGWKILPLHSIINGECTCGKISCSDIGKHPFVKRGVKEATNDIKKIKEWMRNDINIGIATGEVSGITVIDIDIGEGKMGAESWSEIIKEKGEPQTLMARTGSGGMHIIFQYNSLIKTSSNILGVGIDCRNDGGYIVAPPSKHKSGGVYEWINFGEKISVFPAYLVKQKAVKRKKEFYKSKYTLNQIEEMLKSISSNDRDLWRNVGIILGREFDRSEKAWDVYIDWSNKYEGKKGRNHDKIMEEAFYEISQQVSDNELTIGTIIKLAIENGWSPTSGEVPVENLIYFTPENKFVYRPTGSYWVQEAVNSAVSPVNDNGKILKPSDWIKKNQLCTSMTSDPSISTDFLKGYDCINGEIVKVNGSALYNSYRPPTVDFGDSKLATPFMKHLEKMFNKEGDSDQFLNYMAHRVQKPWEKPRFALLIAGGQGVGKDTVIEFCCPAIGSWNVYSIDPSAFDSQFNEYCASTLVRINEAANLHEMTKWAFNERTKVLIAGSPDNTVINPKYGKKYTVRMYCGVIITTNHLSGIYISPDDRRYDVLQCATLGEIGIEDEGRRREYFQDLWEWFLHENGSNHIAALLNERDIAEFSPSNGQRKTYAHSIIIAGGLEKDSWLDDILDSLNYPKGIRADFIIEKAVSKGENEYNVRRKMGNALNRLGYVLFKSSTKDGRWKINGKKVTVYVKNGVVDYNPAEELKDELF